MGMRYHGGQMTNLGGDEDKVYFPRPTVVEINFGKKDPVETAITEISNLDAKVRLKSSHEAHGYTPPVDVKYELPMRNVMQAEVDRYLIQKEIGGFGEGAIVARRYDRPERKMHFFQWGMIIVANKRANYSVAPWSPYMVKWFNNPTLVEPAWAEDLLVVHACVDRGLLGDIFESQGAGLPVDIV